MPSKKKKSKKKITKKKKRRKKKVKLPDEIKPSQVILKNRLVYLYGVINNNTSLNISKELITLDKLEVRPIIMMINSPGGSITDAFSIIDSIRGVRSPVVTIISGLAASAAGLISVCGDKKLMTENSVFMCHDGKTGIIDYFEKVFDRTEWVKKLQVKLFKIYRDNTEMTEKDLEKSRHGELWLFPKECKEKKIVDNVIGELK